MPVSRATAPIIRSGFPRAGSLSGNQKRDEFEAFILGLMGTPTMLWLPRSAETTTSTDRSRNAATLTYDATFAGQYATLGSGVSASFDGTTDYATAPDLAAYSFGDGTFDTPFSIVAVVNVTNTATSKTILARRDLTTGVTKREFLLYLNSSELPIFLLYDESAGATIGRTAPAVTAATWLFLAVTYDGSRTAGGIRIYSAAVQVDNADDNSGTYVAGEDTASLLYLGCDEDASGAMANFYSGSMAMVGYGVGKQLSVEELWEMSAGINAYYGL